MKKQKPESGEPAAKTRPEPAAAKGPALTLRRQVEAQFLKQAPPPGVLSEGESLRLLYELQVHQIELEMQNEELLKVRDEVKAGLERYTDLYDFAPVSYFTFDADGYIQQLNLTGARLLGGERARLMRRRFAQFVAEGDHPLFNVFLKRVFSSEQKQACEISLLEEHRDPVWVRMEGVATANGQECRAAAVDITQRRQAESALRQSERDFSTLAANAPDMIVRFDTSLRHIYCNQAVEDQMGQPLSVYLGKTPLELGSPPSQQSVFIMQSLQKVLDSETGLEVEQNFPTPWGLKRFLTRIVPERDRQGKVESLLAITRNITRRYLAEEEIVRLNQELEQRVQVRTGELANANLALEGKISQLEQAQDHIRKQAARAEALVRTAAQFNARLDFDTLLQAVCQEAAAALHTPSAWINLYDAGGDNLYFSSGYGIPDGFEDRYQPVPRAQYAHFASLVDPVTVISDQQLLTGLSNTGLYAALDIRTVALAGMYEEEQLIGTISVVVYGEPRRFSEDELGLLRGLANQAALAIAKMRLFEQVSAGREHMRALSQALVEIQETERRNLALELHDELGQVLSAAKLSLDMFPTLPKPAADKQLQFVRSMLGELVGRVRRMALDLRPSMLDDLGLLPALAWLFENYQSQSGEGVTFLHQDLEQRFSPQVEITAYRIIQESLTNVMRHAGNGRVEVNARADGQALYLQIRDFGTGFDPATALSGTLSSGLSGMRERIRMLGGEMAIDSAPGKGTCLTARLPLVLIHDSSA